MTAEAIVMNILVAVPVGLFWALVVISFCKGVYGALRDIIDE